jgi:hypothetical protein
LPGGHFGAHYDGCFVESEDERSIFTFMIYLNSGYKGGLTRFLSDEKVDIGQILQTNSGQDKNLQVSEEDREVVSIVQPIQPGTCVVISEKF